MAEFLRTVAHDESTSMAKRGGDRPNGQLSPMVRDCGEKQSIATVLKKLIAHKISDFACGNLAA
jgi:hypothetical protein